MGCLPAVITFFSQDAFNGRKCVEIYSSIARDYNELLQTKLKDMQNSETKIYYADIYKSFSDILQSPDKFGELTIIPLFPNLLTPTPIFCNGINKLKYFLTMFFFLPSLLFRFR